MTEGTGDRQPFEVAVETVLKALAIAGALVYGALFLGYRNYYSALGLSPEDVGVSNTYVLVRSVGFIALMALPAVALMLVARINSGYESGPVTRGDVARWAAMMALGLAIAGYLAIFTPEGWPPYVQYVALAAFTSPTTSKPVAPASRTKSSVCRCSTCPRFR